MPLYLQLVMGQSVAETGVMLLVMGLGSALALPIAGALTDRHGAGIVSFTGAILNTADAKNARLILYFGRENMTHEFDGKKYEKTSDHQKEWGARLIAELNLNGSERVLDLGSLRKKIEIANHKIEADVKGRAVLTLSYIWCFLGLFERPRNTRK